MDASKSVPIPFLTLKAKTLKFRNSLNALLLYYYNKCTRTRLIFIVSRLSYLASLRIQPGGGGGVLGLIFARYVPLACQGPYPIIVYSVGNYRPRLGHFWTNM